MKTGRAFGREKAGLYIHIPFCVRKCIYCDFNSIPGCSQKLQSDYFEGLKREISMFRESLSCLAEQDQSPGCMTDIDPGLYTERVFQEKQEIPFADTLFIGGGTPSAVDPALVEDLLSHILHPDSDIAENLRKTVRLLSDDAEITMEVNPATVDPVSLRRYREAGVNRLSIGVQSFCDSELKFLGRIHTSGEAEACFYDARRAGFDNINIDLIFGIPGSGSESWRKTLQKALSLRPDHLSFYSLQIEEGTPLYEMFRRDEAEQVSDEENRRMYHEAIRLLGEAGYCHYEISNAALPGRECRHNLKYWSMCDYAGFGVSAHSYLQYPYDGILDGIVKEDRENCTGKYEFHSGVRFCNEDGISEYLDRILRGEKNIRGHIKPWHMYKNSLRDEISETLFTGLRKREGISLSWFDERFEGTGVIFLDEFGQKMASFIDEGYLIFDGQHLRFSIRGADISNYILSELI